MSDPPPPSYTPSAPQIMITPLASRAGWVAAGDGGGAGKVEGEVWVKGLGLVQDKGRAEEGRRVESLTITLSLVDTLPGFPDIPLFRSPPHTLYDSTTPHAFSTSHAFSIPLGHEDAARMPACVHLPGAGEARYELEAVLRLRSARGGGAGVEETREAQVVHLTPFAGEEEEAVGVTGPTAVQRVMTRDGRGTRMRLLMASPRARIGEALPVGVEIGAAGEDSSMGEASDAGPEPRALRRVKLELYRRVRTPSTRADGPSTSTSSTTAPAWTTHTSLLWRSGKSCRFSARQPIRLMFHLPPHASVHPMAGPSRTGTSDAIACGEVSQETPYHQVSFFVRAIAGFAEGEGPGRADVDVALDQELEIVAPRPGQLVDEITPAPPTHLAGDEALAQRLSYDDDVPDSEEARNEAYRRKGTDVVGAGGTYRPELPDVMQQAEGSSSTPQRMPYHGSAGMADPPPFSAEALPPPFAAVAGGSQDAPQQVHQDPPPLGATSGADLPTFQESQSHAPRSRAATTTSQPAFTFVPTTGELAAWIEYDGYESFSQPPPPATASLGLSGSMDPPPAGEEPVVDSAVVRELLDSSGAGTSGVQDRIRLMAELGLGDGTRVVDTHEDMPPGIDEPSLPALPDMSRRRSMSHEADMQVDVAAMAASNEQAIGASPPSFAASERAEAGADHPPPLYSTSRADLPPSYR